MSDIRRLASEADRYIKSTRHKDGIWLLLLFPQQKQRLWTLVLSCVGGFSASFWPWVDQFQVSQDYTEASSHSLTPNHSKPLSCWTNCLNHRFSCLEGLIKLWSVQVSVGPTSEGSGGAGLDSASCMFLNCVFSTDNHQPLQMMTEFICSVTRGKSTRMIERIPFKILINRIIKVAYDLKLLRHFYFIFLLFPDVK